MKSQVMRILMTGTLSLSLGGCYTLNRLENLGTEPPVTPIKDPTLLPNYHPVTMPMPESQNVVRQKNSLWTPGARGFFKDQRAKKVGDILTVKIDISENAKMTSKVKNDKTATEATSMNNAFGFEKYAQKVLPHGYDLNNLAKASSTPHFDGSGETGRTDVVKFDLAATITQILPNGNYVISGHQETRVNFDVRELGVTGIVRPEDITSTNDVPLEKIAQARLIYGGRGHLVDSAKPGWGQELLHFLSPF